MLAKENRLRQSQDFRRVLSQKQGVRQGGLLLKTAKKGGAPHLGVVVSKKVAKKAVVRNRIRRVLQEAMRKEVEHIPEGTDLVLVVLPGFELTSQKDIHSLIHSLLKKAALVH